MMRLGISLVLLITMVCPMAEAYPAPSSSVYTYTKRYGRHYNTHGNGKATTSNMANRVERGSKHASEMSKLIHSNSRPVKDRRHQRPRMRNKPSAHASSTARQM